MLERCRLCISGVSPIILTEFWSVPPVECWDSNVQRVTTPSSSYSSGHGIRSSSTQNKIYHYITLYLQHGYPTRDTSSCNRLRCSRGSVLAFGTQVRGFTPGRSRRIFRAKKKSSARLLSGGEVKPSAPWRSFTACKIYLNVTWKSAFR